MTHVPRVVGALLVLAAAACVADPGRQSIPDPQTSTAPPPQAGSPPGPAAVWWDADGLHRGDLVQETPVSLTSADDPDPATTGATARPLALVRSGALYRDPATGQVWFHPWDGAPRVVGRSTPAGPGGDPESDVAAWFDGPDLVVYDTARDRVVSRSREPAAVSTTTEYVEHVGHGRGWIHVSPTQVVWRYEGQGSQGVARRDLVTGTSETPWRPRPATRAAADPSFVDVSSTSAVWVGGHPYEGHGTYLFDSIETERTAVVDAELEHPGRLSPDGSWLLTAEIADGTHGVAMTDLSSGEVWKPFDEDTYAFFSWAYGDVAVMRTNRDVPDGPWVLTSCVASTRSCVELATRGSVVLPNP